MGWFFGGAENEEGEAAGKTDADKAGGSAADVEGATAKSDHAVTVIAKISTQPSDGESGGDDNDASCEGDGGDGKVTKKVVLSKSTRLKGYMTFTVASAINYYAANESDLRDSSAEDRSLVVPASEAQRKYAMAVSMTTIIVAVFCVIVHFDRFTCLRKAWMEAFKPGSKIELSILIFLMLWWVIATIVNTQALGVAGPGKGQYNLYFSTWVNLWTSIWTMDRWLTANGSSSFKTFMDSWPNRSPGWLFMFALSLACLCSVVDLFKNWGAASATQPYRNELYSNVGKSEWEFQIFVAAFTLPTALAFSLVELFRVSRIDVENTKSDRENIVEGFTLTLLVLFWVPVVILATTPGGSASLVGNAYFFTWFTTIVVIETFVWWIRDWRKGIHEVVRMQEEEYHRAQRETLRKHKQAKKAAAVESGDGNGGKQAGPSK